MTPQGWVTRPPRGGSRDPSGVRHETPQGWVTRPPRGASRDPPWVGHVTPHGWVRRHLKGGPRDPREACCGEPECARAAHVEARKEPAAARRKAISWGPPHVPPVLKEDPFTDGRKRGSSQWWVRARGLCGFASTYARCPHTGPRCLSPVEAEGCLLLDASVLRGQGTAWALPGPHRAPDP